MDYAAAIAAAPPGWKHFSRRDIDRLPQAVKEHALPAIPIDDVRLMRDGDARAEERVLRAMFWTLLYQLEPQLWDRLAAAEPIADPLLAALPRAAHALDVGAGSGRLTAHLVRSCERVIALEPSLGLIELLRARVPEAQAIAAWAEAIPLPDGWSQLTAACGAFGPEPAVLRELERVTWARGVVALINPEQPEWFESHGWRRSTFEPARVLAHDPSLDEFFGPPDPPRELVVKQVGG
ncbi:MAG TPA: methyltransferase domain-containing protein [Candidatus Dormibacteraeota bacterium]|nr:methyltransferase domain-containing protein [Candidatus Dormibacteraeota bacterium]